MTPPPTHSTNDPGLDPAGRPQRILVVLPSWVGDAVMATPALRLLRECLRGAFIGALTRPGLQELLGPSDLFDEWHTDPRAGVMGPKRAAAKVRPRRYQWAILLTGSFSSALTTRVAGIPRRFGYERDARGMLLTDTLTPPKRRDTPPYDKSSTDPGAWAPISAVNYYADLVGLALTEAGLKPGSPGPLELSLRREEELAAADLLESAGIRDRERLVVLNPGGNRDNKRWPADRFAALADHLAEHYGCTILINGSPAEAELAQRVADLTREQTPAYPLPQLGITLASLKGVLSRSKLLVTNDTGPRHIATALAVPSVTLFGPTDARWTTLKSRDAVEVLADPTLDQSEVANDHPERCAITKIGLGDVVKACAGLLEEHGVHAVTRR